MHKYAAGADNLNSIFQKKINTASYLNIDSGFHVKPGDKVMQRKNNYQKNIYNGDIGFVSDFKEGGRLLRVVFSGEIVEYTEEELDQLILAYAITVHKSQGSEFPCVILPVSKKHRHMLQRNLLYTAATRASELLIIVGSGTAFHNGIRNDRVITRFSSLLAH
jgi:exodeoxyribonuclease V alpha subunit